VATNAVVHSRSGFPGGNFGVQIAIRADEWVRVAVEDAGGPWERHGIDDDAECGRGLQVVSALAAEMGIIGSGPGRTVWFRCPWDPREDCHFRPCPPHLSCAEGGMDADA
jgi:anti-sigma regulatory factor (Ser/Thr protein kinase)